MIDRDLLRPGMMTQTRAPGSLNICGCVRCTLSRKGDPCHWCHNGMVVAHGRGLAIVDPVPPRVKITTIDQWNRNIQAGYKIEFLWPKGATEAQGHVASSYMLYNAVGQDYPELTALRLAWLKLMHISWPIRPLYNPQYRRWCTLWDRASWRVAHLDWSTKPDGRVKENPTPKTVQNRVAQGVLEVRLSY